MSRVKLKIFTASLWMGLEDASKNCQDKVDNWAMMNVEVQIINSDMCSSKDGLILTVKYYESKKRDLMLEKKYNE